MNRGDRKEGAERGEEIPDATRARDPDTHRTGSLGEVALVLGFGGAHLLADSVLRIKGPFLVAALVFWTAWIAVRVRRDPGVLRDWGFRLDNWRPAGLASGAILVAGSAGMVAFAAARGTLRLPAGFWILLPLYPFWGTLQQLVLGGLLARNLRTRLSPAASVLVASMLFALVHLPGVELAGLTFVAGLFWVSIFLRWPNAWLLGISHGVLASLAYYLVLEHDVWAALGLGG